MIIKKEIGTDEIAKVYVAEMDGKLIEFVESIQPPLNRNDKWVLIISCLFGCPVGCLMCDAGGGYKGSMTKDQMFKQIDFMIKKRYPDGKVPAKKFKIQFGRMGEPVYNYSVLDVLKELPARYDAPGLIPSVSTIGPKNYDKFFNRLKTIKDEMYGNGMFQLQFSIHTTDEQMRDKLIPTAKLNFQEIANLGKDFFETGDRKITLNFVVTNEYPIDPDVIAKYFGPSIFVIKLTPLNPTNNAKKNNLSSMLDPNDATSVTDLVDCLKFHGFDVIVSIGELEENNIGSNCGQFISAGENKRIEL